jgi:hypothetical protein
MKNKVVETRRLMLAYLYRVGGEAPFKDFIPIYHAIYETMKKDGCGYIRPDRVSSFIWRMEQEDLVRCLCNNRRVVTEVFTPERWRVLHGELDLLVKNFP